MGADSDDGSTSGSDMSVAPSRLFAQLNLHHIPGDTMNQMTAQERSQGYFDLHCVSNPPVEETPELISRALDEFDRELSTVNEDRYALDMALEMNPEYVRGQRLKFLRADLFDAQKAAARLARHFEFRWTGN
mmetsp:Transcript_84380/g.243948  ORF Transcript_84380/g.243948 Transcript_84380/m.243948 type:complete len:132 (+) Transcript_84380:2-397(+)